jgi:hypothetical protein
MRNYELMRLILITCYSKGENLEFCNFASETSKGYKEKEAEFEKELNRLNDEGLLKHNMYWKYGTLMGGVVKGLTPAGVEFARMISDTKVWTVCSKTLKKAELDISYPLIKKVCERIIENIVLSCIPDEFK